MLADVRTENGSVVTSPIDEPLTALVNELASNGNGSLGFMFGVGTGCVWGTFENDVFSASDINIVREFDLDQSGRSCRGYKIQLGTELAYQIDTCNTKSAAATLDALKTFSRQSDIWYASAFEDRSSEIYSGAWEESKAQGTLTQDYQTFIAGYGSSDIVELNPAFLNGDISIVATTLFADQNTGEVFLQLESPDRATGFASATKMSDSIANAFAEGLTISSVDPIRQSLVERWLPLDATEDSQQFFAGNTVRVGRVQRYLYYVPPGNADRGDDPAAPTEVELQLASSLQEALADFRINMQAEPFPFGGIPGLETASATPVLDSFMLRHDISVDDLPERLQAKVFVNAVERP